MTPSFLRNSQSRSNPADITCEFIQVCDQPHPLLVHEMIGHCLKGRIDPACEGLRHLFGLGYSASDIVTTLFRVVKSYEMPEFLKLEFIRVSFIQSFSKESVGWKTHAFLYFQEIGFVHIRITDGVGTLLQMSGLMAKLCRVSLKAMAT